MMIAEMAGETFDNKNTNKTLTQEIHEVKNNFNTILDLIKYKYNITEEEMAQYIQKVPEFKQNNRRPAGRAPNGKEWNPETVQWVSADEYTPPPKIEKKTVATSYKVEDGIKVYIRPRGANPKGQTWDKYIGQFVPNGTTMTFEQASEIQNDSLPIAETDVVPIGENDVVPNGENDDAPVEEVTVVAPVEEETVVAPVEEETVVAPVEEDTVVAPNEEVTVVAPVEEDTVVAPVEEDTVVAPVEEETVVAPVEEETVVAPVEEETVVAPVEKNPNVLTGEDAMDFCANLVQNEEDEQTDVDVGQKRKKGNGGSARRSKRAR